MSKNREAWTKKETERFTSLYPTTSTMVLLEKFPYRTAASLQTYASKLYLKKPSKSWSSNEDELLVRYYPASSKTSMQAILPFRTWSAIQHRASRLGVAHGTNKKWSDEEVDILETNYLSATSENLLSLLPDRTLASIYGQAHTMSLKGKSRAINRNNLKRLLDDSPESWYWLGFILADGCFQKDAIKIALSDRDSSHLEKFATYVSANIRRYGKSSTVEVSCGDAKAVKDIQRLLGFTDGIGKRKTYNPPNNRRITFSDTALLCMFAGFADGDGCIYHDSHHKANTGPKPANLKIETHVSWGEVFESWDVLLSKQFGSDWKSALYRYEKQTRGFGKTKVCDTQVAIWMIGNVSLREVKTKALELGIPLLSRKWDKVYENYLNRKDAARLYYDAVCDCFNKGMSVSLTASKLGLSYRTVWRWHKKWNASSF